MNEDMIYGAGVANVVGTDVANRAKAALLSGLHGKQSRTQIQMTAMLSKRLSAAVDRVNAELPTEAQTDTEGMISLLISQFCDDMGV